MNSPITILHINQKYEISYWIIRENTKIVSSIPLFQAIDLLKTNEFDLILSEPQNLAIITDKTFQQERKIKEDNENGNHQFSCVSLEQLE